MKLADITNHFEEVRDCIWYSASYTLESMDRQLSVSAQGTTSEDIFLKDEIKDENYG